jgi:hypothetical protein
MFDRVASHQDIEKMDILYQDEDHPKSDVIVEVDRIYFPYKALDTDGFDNEYQSSFVSSENKLYIVIDPEKNVKDIYPDIV